MLRVPKLWRNEHLLPGNDIDDYVDCDDDDAVCDDLDDDAVCLFVMLIYSAAELGICGKSFICRSCVSSCCEQRGCIRSRCQQSGCKSTFIGEKKDYALICFRCSAKRNFKTSNWWWLVMIGPAWEHELCVKQSMNYASKGKRGKIPRGTFQTYQASDLKDRGQIWQ